MFILLNFEKSFIKFPPGIQLNYLRRYKVSKKLFQKKNLVKASIVDIIFDSIFRNINIPKFKTPKTGKSKKLKLYIDSIAQFSFYKIKNYINLVTLNQENEYLKHF